VHGIHAVSNCLTLTNKDGRAPRGATSSGKRRGSESGTRVDGDRGVETEDCRREDKLESRERDRKQRVHTFAKDIVKIFHLFEVFAGW